MQWIPLNTLEQLNEIDRISHQGPVFIFKHSTRCMISGVVLSRLERACRSFEERSFFHLDLLRFRKISDAIESRYGIDHASPQLLVIRNGQCVHSATHLSIDHSIVGYANGDL